MGVEEATIRRIRGDCLSLKLGSNEQILEITGDGCTISMAKNCGSVRIIGDGCRLKIDQNVGKVEYTGDGGRVLLGPKSSKDHVKYVGDGGKVTFDGDSKTNSKNRRSEQTSRKKSDKKIPEGIAKSAGEDKGRSKSVEEAENAKNEAKVGRGQRQETLVKTRVVTELFCEEDIVRRWFVSPGSVIRSCGGTFVKIVPRVGKTQVKVK